MRTLDILIKTSEVLIQENYRLKKRNAQLQQICRQHVRAVDFYIKKLDEAEKELRIRERW